MKNPVQLNWRGFSFSKQFTGLKAFIDMKLLNALIGGFAGAIALNILHETVKQYYDKAPRIDLLGEEALEKSMEAVGAEPPEGKNLYLATLAGDIISNGLYYSAIGMGGTKNIYIKGTVAGLAAGIGALELPGPMGLDDLPVTYSKPTKALTVSWYLFGGLVAAAVITALENKRKI